MFKRVCIGLMFALFIQPLFASQYANRSSASYMRFGGQYMGGENVTFEGGSSFNTQGDEGFTIGGGYHFNSHFSLDFGYSYLNSKYEASLADMSGTPRVNAAGKMDFNEFTLSGIYHIIDGPITPYVGASIGYASIDSNIYAGSDVYCWWHPWWGYICDEVVQTFGTDEMTYAASAGILAEFKGGWFMRAGVGEKWIDLDGATGSPSFTTYNLEFGMSY